MKLLNLTDARHLVRRKKDSHKSRRKSHLGKNKIYNQDQEVNSQDKDQSQLKHIKKVISIRNLPKRLTSILKMMKESPNNYNQNNKRRNQA